MDSIHLVKSLKKEVSGHLNSKDIAFCNELISNGIVDKQQEDALNDYIHTLLENGTDFSKIEQISNYLSIYLTINQSLLFSYKIPSDASLNIPSKYYKAAPDDFESLIVVLPELKIIIKADNFNKKMGYGTQLNKASNLISIKTYFNKTKNQWYLLQEGSFITAYYPRFSVACPKHCSCYIEANINNFVNDTPIPTFIGECKMSPNRECICKRDMETKEYFNCPSLSDCYAIVMMCFDRWKNRPVRTNTSKSKSYNDEGVATIFVQTQENQKQAPTFKEVSIKDSANYIENMRAHGWKIKNRLSPCEHRRREHLRHLKNGKIITVRGSIVNKGKSKTIYKI